VAAGQKVTDDAAVASLGRPRPCQFEDALWFGKSTSRQAATLEGRTSPRLLLAAAGCRETQACRVERRPGEQDRDGPCLILRILRSDQPG
jgi:hypothetical protein